MFLVYIIFEMFISKRLTPFKFCQSSLERLNDYPPFERVLNEIPLLNTVKNIFKT